MSPTLKEAQVTSNTSVLKMQHSSLQYSDTNEQILEDVEKLFARGKQFPIKTGTEAGPETFNDNALRQFAKEYNHVLHIVRGCWIAVDKSIIKPGTVKRSQVFVALNDDIIGRMHDRIFATLAFTHADVRIGRISQASIHYPTKGRTKNDPNNDINELYSKRIGEWMRVASRGTALSFVNGDFNMSDRIPTQDWAFGENFTSMADELEAWKNTGHGPIDGFASYDRDGRVSPKRFQVLNDTKFPLHTDHFVCRGTWNVKHLKTTTV